MNALPCTPCELRALFDHLDVNGVNGCEHTALTRTRAFARARGVHEDALAAWLRAQGGDCDCSVLGTVEPEWRQRLASDGPRPVLKAFPDLHEVFADPPALAECVLFPLLSVDLASIGQGQGWVHFVSVQGVGDPGHEGFGTDLGFDHIRFDWDGQRYRVRADLQTVPHAHELLGWHAEARAWYKAWRWFVRPEAARQDFERMLAGDDGPWCGMQQAHEAEIAGPARTSAEQAWQAALQPRQPGMLARLTTWLRPGAAQVPALDTDRVRRGYQQSLVNHWLTRDAWRATGCLIQGSAYLEGASPHVRALFRRLITTPQAPDRDGLCKIGSLAAYDYRHGAEDCISLFVDPPRAQVLQRFGWS
jgi:hypothetical protein